MKFQKLVATIVAVLSLNAVWAQGTVHFNTRVNPGVDVKVYHMGGITPLAGDGFTAQLFGGPVGSSESSLMPLYPVTGFLTGADAGYVVPVASVEVPGIPEGGSASVLLRVWENQGQQISTYEEALTQGVFHGQSAIIDIAWLGGDVLPPATLTGLQSFALIPEPQGLFWLALGFSLLALRKARAAGRSE
jgi:hypothetical protein